MGTACPWHGRMSNNTHGLSPLDVSSTPAPGFNSKIMSPDIANVPWGFRNTAEEGCLGVLSRLGA